MIHELIKKNRSYRRFDTTQKISLKHIEKWIDLARMSPSARNLQPLKYIICTDEKINDLIFPNLGWAGYLAEWAGPEENERPVAYIVVTLDKSISETSSCDEGIAMQSILLGAVEDGFGGCIIGSVNKSKVSRLLQLPPNLEVMHVLALGKPVEEVVIVPEKDGDVKYWRDENMVHHVPKRSLQEIIQGSF